MSNVPKLPIAPVASALLFPAGYFTRRVHLPFAAKGRHGKTLATPTLRDVRLQQWRKAG